MKRLRNSESCYFGDGSHEALFQGDTSDVVPYAACFGVSFFAVIFI